ncbi:MAG TPA: hypothetical protein VM103_00285 [Candidatus Paceibacterota bacterium]|nr:hypothetical protein [Candidatus Paceibacterota bacterium]
MNTASSLARPVPQPVVLKQVNKTVVYPASRKDYNGETFFQTSSRLYVVSGFATHVGPRIRQVKPLRTMFGRSLELDSERVMLSELRRALPGDHCFEFSELTIRLAQLLERRLTGDEERFGLVANTCWNLFFTPGLAVGTRWHAEYRMWCVDAWTLTEDFLCNRRTRVFLPS